MKGRQCAKARASEALVGTGSPEALRGVTSYGDSEEELRKGEAGTAY